MTTNPSKAAAGGDPGQRQALNESEKKASEKQPGSYREEATAEKVVEIPPAGPNEKPIRGLDSK
ncbi:MAG: hypothetical protein ABI460_12720 [Caldimonas sp.]